MRTIEITIGTVFNRLTVIARGSSGSGKGQFWVCRCECGNEVSVSGGSLRKNNKKSCGCLNLIRIRERFTQHGQSKAPEYLTWLRMKNRCHNPDTPKYRDYGARGITVCAEWLHDYPAFLAHVGPKPGSAYSIDRIDNDRGYEPGNVRWATAQQQVNNRRITRKRYDLDGKAVSISDLAAYLAMSRRAAYYRFCVCR